MKSIRTISLSLMVTMIPCVSFAQNTFDEMVYSKVKTIFKLNAPTSVEVDGNTGASTQITPKNTVKVRIYNAGEAGKAVKTVKMKATGKDRWEATIKGDLAGKYYTFDMGKGETPGVFA